MKSCIRLSCTLLKLIYVPLLPAVLVAQQVNVLPEVTGYLGHDVTLPCHFIQGREVSNITQVQWDLLQPGKKKQQVILSDSTHGDHIPESRLKERVEISGQSLTIRDVQMEDAGSYTCSLTTFPSGPLTKTTTLVVQEQKQLSAGMVSAIVTAMVLLLVIMAAMAYLIFFRRRDSSGRHRVFIDAAGPVTDVARPSIIVTEEDVVYSDVTPSRKVTPPSNDRHRKMAHADDVTYSEVLVSCQRPT
ncbi:nectin-2-like isoform X1 [Embiotoca jacksoni]|uniref:nectin-2-like isoform X1 n=1 Tax=Embiotoca jacksoni TaxID=100190 RepID=UPI0037037D81